MKHLKKKPDGKNAKYCFELVLKAALHKTASVHVLASHLRNHPSKTNMLGTAGK